MQRGIRRLSTTIFLGFLAVSLALVYWQVIRAEELTTRRENPRLVEEEVRIQRGAILDRRGRPLVSNALGAQGYVRRIYHHPPLVHVTGFLNPRQGPSGLEKSLDPYLAGRRASDPWLFLRDRLLQRPRQGQDVVLTIDLELQKAAEAALGGAQGAVVALNPKSGAILALVSSPWYDPNLLTFDLDRAPWREEGTRTQALWEELLAQEGAPLLNRATQGLYAPGSTFKTVTLAAALEQGIARPDTAYEFALEPPNAEHRVAWHRNPYIT